jgi:hypothetical protein
VRLRHPSGASRSPSTRIASVLIAYRARGGARLNQEFAIDEAMVKTA